MCTTKKGVVHEKQHAAMVSTALSLLVMCARQVGKTELFCGLLWLTASATDDVSCLYLALTAGQSRKVWHRKWKPLLRRNRVPASHSETDMITTFPNGSVVQFGATDDLAHMVSLFGDSMAGGIAIVDEAQDQRHLQYLCEDILEPMLSQTTDDKPVPGRLVVGGKVPETPAGYFWDLWTHGLVADQIDNVQPEGDGWERHNWSRFDNVFFQNPQADLERTLKRYRLTVDDPKIQRDFFGRWIFSAELRAFRYDPTKNTYEPVFASWAEGIQLPPGKLLATVPALDIDRGAVGIDPAQSADRFTIVAWGWSSTRRSSLIEIAEWVTERAANALFSQWMQVIRTLKDHYPFLTQFKRDSGSNSETVDFVYKNEKLYIEPAIKGAGSLRARVDRLSDLLGTENAKVIKGGKLAEDLLKARWSKQARAAGQYKWDSTWHPDVGDAATYGSACYTETAPERDTSLDGLTRAQIERKRLGDEARAHLKEMYDNPQPDKPERRDTKTLWR